MLRSLGIPARVVNGYGPGAAEEQAGPGRVNLGHIVSTTDAHTWVEAYFPGAGWVAFEPTPPSELGDYRPVTRGPVVSNPTPGPSSSGAVTAAPSAAATPTATPGASAGIGSRGRSPWLTALLLATVVGLAGAAGWLLGMAWWRQPRSLAGVWRRIAVAGRLAGLRRSPSETRTAYAARLGRRLRVEAPFLTLAAVTGKAEFAAEPLDFEDVRSWRDAWHQAAEACVRHGFRWRPWS